MAILGYTLAPLRKEMLLVVYEVDLRECTRLFDGSLKQYIKFEK